MELIEYIKLIEEYERVKNFKKLREIVNLAEKEFPYSSTIKMAKLKVLIYEKNVEEAKRLADELIKTNPGNPQIHTLMGKLYESVRDFRKAKVEYEKVIFLEPSNIEVAERIKALDLMLKDQIYEEKEVSFEKQSDKKDFEKKEDLPDKPESLEEEVNVESVIEKGLDDSEEYDIDDEIGDTLVEDVFETFSMAKVYEEQGELGKAREIYHKLYKTGKDERYKKAYMKVSLKIYKKILENFRERVLNGKGYS